MISKALLLVLSVITLLCSSAFIETKNNPIQVDVPKISMYLGSSYHVLFGNPKSEYGLDPGFYHPVF